MNVNATPFHEVVLGLFSSDYGEPVDYFAAALSLAEVERLLQRAAFFNQYRLIDLDLHEIVFESNLACGFYRGDPQAHQHPDRRGCRR